MKQAGENVSSDEVERRRNRVKTKGDTNLRSTYERIYLYIQAHTGTRLTASDVLHRVCGLFGPYRVDASRRPGAANRVLEAPSGQQQLYGSCTSRLAA
jgi:hypothetical protein